MAQSEFSLISQDLAAAVFGPLDENIVLIERAFDVRILGRGDSVAVVGGEEGVEDAKAAMSALLSIVGSGGALDEQSVRYCVNMVKSGEQRALGELDRGVVLITSKGKPIKPKTLGQKRYIEAIEKNFIVFGIGPAGTGKTYLAVVMAVKALKSREVSRIILTRPAVEAGEKLGFLPGDLQTKIDPYLRPLYDALFDTLGAENMQKHQEKGVIEVAPLAYMRGRTLDSSFVILDEAQNTTPEQMKMFLTRLGSGSKMVVNGDITQIDLADGRRSGLVDAAKILKGIEGIGQIRFSEKDVVRFRLVADIVKAYDRAAQRGGRGNSKK
jgi:phosphate starvation-inducible PhoH-like protein